MLLALSDTQARGRYFDRYAVPVGETDLSNFDGGIGSEWVVHPGDTAVNDSKYVLHGSRSIGMYVQNNGYNYIDKSFSTPVDLSNNNYISFSMYAGDTNYDALNSVELYFSSDDNFLNYYSYACWIRSVCKRGCINFTLNLDDSFGSVTGTPSWENIKKIRLRINSESNKGRAYFVIDQLRMYGNPLSKGQVIITIDDGQSSVYSFAKPIFDRYGIKPTLYIIGGLVNVPQYLTKSQIDTLYNEGYEIGSHSWSHLHMDQLDSVGVDTQCTKNIKYLRANGYRNYSLFAFPYGARNDTTCRIVNKYHPFTRTVDGAYVKGTKATYVPIPLYGMENMLPALVADTSISLETMTAGVDSAIVHKVAVSYCFHNFGSIAGYERTDTAMLNQFCAYLQSKVDAGLLTVSGMGGFLKFSPDSCAIEKSRLTTKNGYTLNDSCSTDADSMRFWLYDSSSMASWTRRDSTKMLPGGALFTLSRTNAPAGILYYRVIGQANSGSFDSAFAAKNISVGMPTATQNPICKRIVACTGLMTTNDAISYMLLKNSFVSIRLFNAQGKIIVSQFESSKPAGKYEMKWAANGIAQGLYLLEFATEDFCLSKKVSLFF